MPTYNDISHEKYEQLETIVKEMSKELFDEGYSKDSIYTFIHTTADVGIYEAEIWNALERRNVDEDKK